MGEMSFCVPIRHGRKANGVVGSGSLLGNVFSETISQPDSSRDGPNSVQGTHIEEERVQKPHERLSIASNGTLVDHDDLAVRNGKGWAAKASILQLISGKGIIVERTWRDSSSIPSEQSDQNLAKISRRYEDVKHEQSMHPLLLTDNSFPSLVEAGLASMAPGSLDKSIFLWNKRLARYAKAGEYRKTIELFKQLQREGMNPNEFTFVPVLNACSHLRALEQGRCVHLEIVQTNFKPSVYVSNALVDMYAKCGSIEDAWKVFCTMNTRNVVSWTAMIVGSVKCGQGQRALQLFQEMVRDDVRPNPVTFLGTLRACVSLVALDEGRRVHENIIRMGHESNIFVGNSLLDMYAKCGSIHEAWIVFSKMPIRDVVSWTAMIMGFVKCGQGQKALDLFQTMLKEGVEPNPVTFVGVLSACASLLALDEGRLIHKGIIQRGCELDVYVGSCLVDMYCKCGSIEDAWKVFNKMPKRNVVSWNAMLGGCAMHGHAKEALGHFERMCQAGVQVTGVTFASLLSACSHAGLVDEGMHFFELMNKVYGFYAKVDPYHYACMIDLLGRAGRLHEAEDLVKTMTMCTPNASVWMSLLGACRVHGNVEMGENVARHLLQLDPENAAGYVLLSNIYAAAGNWERSASVQRERVKRGVKKFPGRAWIEVNDMVHLFGVDDEHPQLGEILAELKRLSVQMEEAGYVPDTKFVLHDIEEDDKLFLLCHHSEKLAIAYGLMNTPPGSPIRIFKNLRVCGDCHTSTKFLSKITGRSIVVRDGNRFHHFLDGLCSCMDYW